MSKTPNVLYHHQRLQDAFGTILPKGGVTYAFAVSVEDQQIDVALSICSLDDTFVRSFGRDQSTKRLTDYLDGKQVVTAGGDNNIVSPLAYSVSIEDARTIMLKDGYLFGIKQDLRGEVLKNLNVQDISTSALVGIITSHYVNVVLPGAKGK